MRSWGGHSTREAFLDRGAGHAAALLCRERDENGSVHLLEKESDRSRSQAKADFNDKSKIGQAKLYLPRIYNIARPVYFFCLQQQIGWIGKPPVRRPWPGSSSVGGGALVHSLAPPAPARFRREGCSDSLRAWCCRAGKLLCGLCHSGVGPHAASAPRAGCWGRTQALPMRCIGEERKCNFGLHLSSDVKYISVWMSLLETKFMMYSTFREEK